MSQLEFSGRFSDCVLVRGWVAQKLATLAAEELASRRLGPREAKHLQAAYVLLEEVGREWVDSLPNFGKSATPEHEQVAPSQEWCSKGQAAVFLGVDEKTVYNLAER